MQSALNGAEVEIYGLLSGRFDDHEFRKRYPDLTSDLAKLDLALDQRLVLDTDPYPPGNRILLDLRNLKHEAIGWWEKTRYPEDRPSLSVIDANYECSMRVKQLRQQVEALRQALAQEHRKTYD